MTPLTYREKQVLTLLAKEGVTNPEIGMRLGLTTGTVRQYLSHIFRKVEFNRFNVSSQGRVRLVIWYWRCLRAADWASRDISIHSLTKEGVFHGASDVRT